MKRFILIFTFLLTSLFVKGQLVDTLKTSVVSDRFCLGDSAKWTDWSNWHETDVMFIIDYGNNVINMVEHGVTKYYYIVIRHQIALDRKLEAMVADIDAETYDQKKINITISVFKSGTMTLSINYGKLIRTFKFKKVNKI